MAYLRGAALAGLLCLAGCAKQGDAPSSAESSAVPSAGAARSDRAPASGAHEAKIDGVWVERETIKRLADEAEPLMVEMGWPDDDRAWFTREILPAYVRPVLSRTNSQADEDRMTRLKPTPFLDPLPKQSGGLGGNQPQPRLNPHWTLYRCFFQPVYEAASSTWTKSLDRVGGGPNMPNAMLSPGLIRMSMYMRNDWGFSPKLVKETPQYMAAELAAALREPGLSGERARLVARELSGLSPYNSNCDFVLEAARLYATREDADLWFADYFLGEALINSAWQARGDKYASETSEEQFKEFHRLLKEAHEHLVAAHRRRPEWPYAAADLVSVSMGLHDYPDESPIGWYREALAADPADWSAGARMANAAAPRWACEDGPKLVRELIKRSAACTDFRSAVPATAVEAVLEAAEDHPDEMRRLMHERGVYDEVKRVLQGYVAAEDPGMRPEVVKTWLMIMAYYAGKPEDALAIVNAPGFQPVMPDEFTEVQPQQIRSWAMVATSARRSTLTEAQNAMDEGRVRDAAIMYRRAATEMPAGDPAAALAAGRADLIARVERAAGGETVSLLDKGEGQVLLGWRVERGWNVAMGDQDAKGWMEFSPKVKTGSHTPDEASVILPVPIGAKGLFAKGYEFEFDVEFRGDPEKANGQCTVRFNRAPWDDEDSVFGPSVIVAPTVACINDSFSDKPKPLPTPGAAREPKERRLHRHLRVRVSGWKMELWEDGKLIDWTAGKSTRDDGHEAGGWVSFSGLGWDGATVRLSGITLSPLKEPLERREVRDRSSKTPVKKKS